LRELRDLEKAKAPLPNNSKENPAGKEKTAEKKPAAKVLAGDAKPRTSSSKKRRLRRARANESKPASDNKKSSKIGEAGAQKAQSKAERMKEILALEKAKQQIRTAAFRDQQKIKTEFLQQRTSRSVRQETVAGPSGNVLQRREARVCGVSESMSRHDQAVARMNQERLQELQVKSAKLDLEARRAGFSYQSDNPFTADNRFLTGRRSRSVASAHSDGGGSPY
jgi:hypothetical protein